MDRISDTGWFMILLIVSVALPLIIGIMADSCQRQSEYESLKTCESMQTDENKLKCIDSITNRKTIFKNGK